MDKGPVRMRSPAKLNLYLEVKGKREDGYHEVKLLNVAVDLCDSVEVELGGKEISIECGHPGVPEDEGNLCHKAARLFFDLGFAPPRGVRIKIDKHIPVAGGLGGGSSNAAATLAALARLTGFEDPGGELIRAAAKIGADVPFFLFHSPAWAEGVGEILSPAGPIPDWTFLIVGFPFGVSASWAYENFDLTSPPKRDTLNHSGNAGNFISLKEFRNDLEPVVTARRPEVLKAKKLLIENGGLGAMMSGSGPTVFGVFDDLRNAEAAALAFEMEHGLLSRVAGTIKGKIIEEFH